MAMVRLTNIAVSNWQLPQIEEAKPKFLLILLNDRDEALGKEKLIPNIMPPIGRIMACWVRLVLRASINKAKPKEINKPVNITKFRGKDFINRLAICEPIKKHEPENKYSL